MNSIIRLCPKCYRHTNIFLDKDNVNINCQCGHCSTMTINTFINQFNHKK